ncbi:MDR family MFS transporter [Heyndrickxia acidicola]|uniref:MDR family MFS transporter n=1 Tax=Heyndrickxia acidicola TaxID=209389 RepID=A0ABU6MHU2_9BACI|nr:MDR family MFS transporter [Heyndrickxia acidicola]MED1204250.1 MDR family MFS transporter [Heyndrickxia acidicola]
MSQTETMQGNRSKRIYILVSIMLAQFMGAIEGTIIATAMPSIVNDLGGFSLYSWVFSAYLLMNTVTVLIYGKLADLLGRKPVLIFGILIFLIGSTLCGLADNIHQLIVFRFIQGFGAGAIMPVASTIVGDIYSNEERAKVQGYLSSVWGISAIAGPAAGGLLVQFASWRLVFWINIPLGLLSVAGLLLFHRESRQSVKTKIDYWGAILIMAALSVLMVVLVEAGSHWKWRSMKTFSFLLGSILLFVLFIYQEKRADDPMMPFGIWRHRPIWIANMVSFTAGIMMIGITTYLPSFVQGVMEKNATVAGFTLTAMSIGWPVSSAISGRLLYKIGLRTTAFIGAFAFMVSGCLFVSMQPGFGPIWAAAASFLLGVGMGMTSTAFIVSIQGSVNWEQRGIATAANMFMRNLGNTLGAALLGGILNSRIAVFLNGKRDQTGHILTLNSTNSLLNQQERDKLAPAVRRIIQDALTASLHTVYWVVFLFAAVSLVFIFFLPKNAQVKKNK